MVNCFIHMVVVVIKIFSVDVLEVSVLEVYGKYLEDLVLTS
jgi:hypothetical protein